MANLPDSSEKFVAPLHLILEPSRGLSRGIAAIHALAGVAAVANPLPLWARLGLLAAVAFSFYLTRRDYVLEPKVQGLTRHADASWEIIRRSGAVPAELADSTVVTRWLVILHLRTETGEIAVPICRDSVDPEAFRRLRVDLRCRIA
jgi:toxin CptA